MQLVGPASCSSNSRQGFENLFESTSTLQDYVLYLVHSDSFMSMLDLLPQ